MKLKKIWLLIFLVAFLGHPSFADERDRSLSSTPPDALAQLRAEAMENQLRQLAVFLSKRSSAMEQEMQRILDRRLKVMEGAMRAYYEKQKKQFFFMVLRQLPRQGLGIPLLGLLR
jgi:hypothetical protein